MPPLSFFPLHFLAQGEHEEEEEEESPPRGGEKPRMV